MRYTAIFEIDPPGIFGLPEGNRTILPVPAQYQSDFYIASHTGTRFRKVAWGSLSVYRPPEAKIDQALDLGKVKGHITDNYASLTIESDDADDAKAELRTLIDTLLQHLALKYNVPLAYNGVIMQDEAGNGYPIRTVSMKVVSFRAYNLDELRDEIQQVQSYAQLSDDRLDRALTYFEHAVWLFEQQSQQGDLGSRHAAYVASSIFLNLWKATTTIVGDPSEKGYQSCYKNLGLDYRFFKDRIGRMTIMRNTLDVAHYYLDATVVNQITVAMGKR